MLFGSSDSDPIHMHPERLSDSSEATQLGSDISRTQRRQCVIYVNNTCGEEKQNRIRRRWGRRALRDSLSEEVTLEKGGERGKKFSRGEHSGQRECKCKGTGAGVHLVLGWMKQRGQMESDER